MSNLTNNADNFNLVNTVPAWMLDFESLQIIVNIINVKIAGAVCVWFVFFKTMNTNFT